MNIKNKIILLNIIIALTIIGTETIIFTQSSFVVEENGAIEVLFCPKNNCSERFTEIILNSSKIKCAFYDLEDEKIISALKNTKSQILVDEDNFLGLGAKVRSVGLMHNKFCIFDEKTVWTGSYNPTGSKNLNNVIIIESSAISENYLKEYEEIKTGGNEKTEQTTINFNNRTLKNYFCPEDKCKEKVLEELEKAEDSIYFLTFTFTDKEIAQLIVEKHKLGVEVKGLMEKFQNSYSVKDYLLQADIDLRFYEGNGFQHNKVFIIDNKTVITGSYNPTKAATTVNDENILIIEQEEIINKFEKYFNSLFGSAVALANPG